MPTPRWQPWHRRPRFCPTPPYPDALGGAPRSYRLWRISCAAHRPMDTPNGEK